MRAVIERKIDQDTDIEHVCSRIKLKTVRVEAGTFAHMDGPHVWILSLGAYEDVAFPLDEMEAVIEAMRATVAEWRKETAS